MKTRVILLLSVISVCFLYFLAAAGINTLENRKNSLPEEKNSLSEKTEVLNSKPEDTDIPPSPSQNKIFTNCIFNSEYSELDGLGLPDVFLPNQIQRYKDLNFNAVHLYDAAGSLVYGEREGLLTTGQITNFTNLLNTVKSNGLYDFLERSGLSRYMYGQRLIYEVSPTNGNQTLNNGFVYLTNETSAYATDQGRTVLHITPGIINRGYICKDIYENLHHTDLYNFRQNDRGKWFIKPVMRIPQGTPDNTKVVTIEVVAFNGQVVKEITIRAGNFHDNNHQYNGGYLDSYFNLNPLLEIYGNPDPGNLGQGYYEDHWWDWDIDCKVDFRVKWDGECEVWFDKMIVDDEEANRMFDVDFQNNFLNPRIAQEMNSFSDINYTFFVDEVTYSQINCLKYVIDKMREYKPDARISMAVTQYLHVRSMKNDNLSYQTYLQELHPDFLQPDHHGLYVDNNIFHL